MDLGELCERGQTASRSAHVRFFYTPNGARLSVAPTRLIHDTNDDV